MKHSRNKLQRINLAETIFSHPETILEGIIRNSPYAMWISDSKGTLIRINQTCRDLLSIKDEEVTGKYNIFKDNIVEQQGFMPMVHEVFEKGKTVNFALSYDSSQLAHLVLEHKTKVILDVTISAVTDSKGNVTNAIIQEVDITDRKRAEEALVNSEIRYRRLFETAQDAILILDADTNKIIDANQFIKDLLGYNPEELLGKALWEIGELKDTLACKISYQELQTKGYIRCEHVPLITKDGRHVDVEVVANAYQVDNNRIIQCNIRDITERKRTEEELRESILFTNKLIEATALSTWISDENGTAIKANPACYKFFGATEEEVIGKYNVFKDEIAEKQGVMPLIKRAYRTGEPVKFLLDYDFGAVGHVNVKDATHKYIEVNLTPIVNKTGKVTNVVSQSIDITDIKRAEKDLRNSEEKYRKLFESMVEGVMYQNAEGEVISVNPSASRLLSASLEEMKNPAEINSHLTAIHEDGSIYPAEEHPSMISLKTGRPVTHAIMGIYTKGGSKLRWININAIPQFRSGDEKPYQTIVTFNDITERRLAEEALRASEQKYRGLFDSMSEGFALHEIILNPDGKPSDYRFLEVNTAFESLTSLKKSDIVGKTISKALVGLEKSWIEVYGRVALTGESATFESFSRPLGKWFEVFAYSPKHGFIATIFMDISLRKQTEETIRHNQELIHLAQSAAKAGAWEWDLKTNENTWSDELYSVYGLEPGSVKPSFDSWMATIHPEDRDKAARAVKQAAYNGSLLETEWRVQDKDGTVRWLMSRGMPLNNSQEETNKYIGIVIDITERKQMEAKTIEIEALKKINLAKSDLLANVSHELRTPLASIKGFIETLIEPDVRWSKQQRLQFLQIANKETDRLTFLIRDLLDMSRLDSGKMVLSISSCTVEEILDSIVGVISVITAKHKFKKIIAPDLPSIQSDKTRIGQVITNLVENATKFSAEGSLITFESKAAKDSIVFSVEDKGEGISKETQENIFDRFHQAERIVSGKTRGTGLGLAICKGIMEAHGGKIWVDSRLGEGSKFSFSIPLNK
jgi:PAS domain S-box-containing protein